MSVLRSASIFKLNGFDLSPYCRTGGIVNADRAIELAEKIYYK